MFVSLSSGEVHRLLTPPLLTDSYMTVHSWLLRSVSDGIYPEHSTRGTHCWEGRGVGWNKGFDIVVNLVLFSQWEGNRRLSCSLLRVEVPAAAGSCRVLRQTKNPRDTACLWKHYLICAQSFDSWILQHRRESSHLQSTCSVTGRGAALSNHQHFSGLLNICSEAKCLQTHNSDMTSL